jgi:hypothetical protein
MNRFKIAAIACLLCGGAAAPAANADDRGDLEVTMQVFDELTEIDNSVTSLRRPRSLGEPDISVVERAAQG